MRWTASKPMTYGRYGNSIENTDIPVGKKMTVEIKNEDGTTTTTQANYVALDEEEIARREAARLDDQKKTTQMFVLGGIGILVLGMAWMLFKPEPRAATAMAGYSCPPGKLGCGGPMRRRRKRRSKRR